MTYPMLRLFLGSLLRHALTAGSGWFVAKGILTPEQAAGVIGEVVNVGVPLLVVVGAAGYSTLRRRFHES